MKKPENDRQFHAFLRRVLDAQAGKVRGEVRKELESISLSPLEELNSFVSDFKGKTTFLTYLAGFSRLWYCRNGTIQTFGWKELQIIMNRLSLSNMRRSVRRGTWQKEQSRKSTHTLTIFA
jgi:hypothetical protein